MFLVHLKTIGFVVKPISPILGTLAFLHSAFHARIDNVIRLDKTDFSSTDQ
jgi:hypothetical protein